MDERKTVLWRSLLLTILIFAVGVLLNHGLDIYRIDTIEEVMRTHEVDSEAYHAESSFADIFGGEQCEVMVRRIANLKEEIRKVGEDLGSYSRFSLSRKKDYDYLKRKYFLLELRFYALIRTLNKQCGDPYFPIVFFYEIDDKISERQGLILQELSKENKERVVVLSLDKDYEDEPLVSLLASHYGVKEAPALIIGEKKFEGLTFLPTINATIQKFLNRPDPYARTVDFLFTPNSAGINIDRLKSQMAAIVEDSSLDNFARGDAQFVLGRLSKNDSLICNSLKYFDQVDTENLEEAALLHETMASIGCGRNRKAFLLLAADEWSEVGNDFRAELLRSLINNTMRLRFDPVAIRTDDRVISGYKTPILPKIQSTNASKVIIGRTSFTLDENDLIISQVDRVHRDWLSGQLYQGVFGDEILTTFSERLVYNESELRADIGWHEGGRLNELKKIGIRIKVGAGTLVARQDGRWFAVDDNGVFRFEVPLDKILYPTTRFLRRDIAVIMDSHGVNMLVEQALRYNATTVLSDCDHPGKVYAAKYLSDRGVKVICFPDKYVYLALGHDLSLVGSPPFTFANNEVVVGGRKITLTLNDVILAVNATSKPYALWYYQTPASYFSVLDKVGLNVSYVTLKNFGAMSDVIDKAKELRATVLATRVFNSADYTAVRHWLLEDKRRRAVVFHTASYPYGQLLLNEFDRVTFDDPNPVIT